jgi:hypothetical protein
MSKRKPPVTFQSQVNHFHTLRLDADHQLVMAEKYAGHYEQTTFSRAAIIHYVLSLEALINRVIEVFWPASLPPLLRESVIAWRTVEKWEKVPRLFRGKTFDVGRLPFQYLPPLFKLRNEYAHAEEGTYPMVLDFLKDPQTNQFLVNPSSRNRSYPHIKLLRDPSQWVPQDAIHIRDITNELIKELDSLFAGELTKKNWLHSDVFNASDGAVITVVRGIFDHNFGEVPTPSVQSEP